MNSPLVGMLFILWALGSLMAIFMWHHKRAFWHIIASLVTSSLLMWLIWITPQ